MATSKTQVLSYLHPLVYERLVEFQQRHNIKSLSSAVEIILREYLDISIPHYYSRLASLSSVKNNPEVNSANLSSQLTALSKDIIYLMEAVSIIQQHLGIETTSYTINEPQVASANDSNNELVNNQHNFIADKELIKTIDKKGLTGVALAERLNSYSSTISNKRSHHDFVQWTASLDPDGIGWKYCKVTLRFHPANYDQTQKLPGSGSISSDLSV